jgi:hypothetical protein
VGAEVNMLTELWYNLKDPEQRYLGPRLGLTMIVEACEDRGEPGIFAIGKEATRERKIPQKPYMDRLNKD